MHFLFIRILFCLKSLLDQATAFRQFLPASAPIKRSGVAAMWHSTTDLRHALKN
jgi:hypothetical protein